MSSGPIPIARHTATDLVVNSFEGFPNDTFEFIEGLRENNNKGWFEAHRSDYEDFYLEPARAFILDVGPALQRFSPQVRAKPKVGGSLFRINRDIRFSSDKPRSAQSHSRRRASPLYIDHTVSIVSASSGRLSGR